MSVALRYVNRELLAIFLVTLVMLLLVALGGRFIGYLQEAAMGKFTGATVLTIMGLRMPEFLQQVAPFSMYIAIVLTLGRLHAEQEMVVLQGAGASTFNLLQWVSLTLLGVVALVAVLALVLTPLSERALSSFVAQQQAQTEFETLNPGTFHVYDHGRRITYSQDMSDDRKVLYDVFLSQRLESGVQVNIWAQQASQYLDPESGSHFLLLKNGHRYEGRPGSPELRVMAFSELRQRLSSVDERPNRHAVEALPTSQLGDGAEGRAQWHWRVGLPLFALIGGFIAVGISRVKPRQGRFGRIVPGTLLMLIYFLALLVNQNAIAEGHVPPYLGMWLVHLVFAGIAAWLLSRVARPVAT
ncbi:MAG: LPS export ABC transporter permease LptF [bacterium]